MVSRFMDFKNHEFHFKFLKYFVFLSLRKFKEKIFGNRIFLLLKDQNK